MAEEKQKNQEEEKQKETSEGQTKKTQDSEVKAEVKETKTTAKKKRGRTKKSAETELEELKIQHIELNDKYLRLFSEFDNFRKRNIKEKLDLTKTASEGVILSLLPVLDDFERAFKAHEENKENDSFVEGITLIRDKLIKTLTSIGLEPMDSIGKEFDTDWHEAITRIPAPSEDMKGKNVDVIERGYLLGGKVIRFAKVVVGS